MVEQSSALDSTTKKIQWHKNSNNNMESTDSCSVGKALEDECHKLTYTRIKLLLNFKHFQRRKILLKWRSSLQHFDTLETVCMHHYKSFIGNAFEKNILNAVIYLKSMQKKSKQTIK